MFCSETGKFFKTSKHTENQTINQLIKILPKLVKKHVPDISCNVMKTSLTTQRAHLKKR